LNRFFERQLPISQFAKIIYIVLNLGLTNKNRSESPSNDTHASENMRLLVNEAVTP
jgi:hypothetical protein